MARSVPCFSITIHHNGETTYRDDIMMPGVDECPNGFYVSYAVPMGAFFRSSISALPVVERNRRLIEWARRIAG